MEKMQKDQRLDALESKVNHLEENVNVLMERHNHWLLKERFRMLVKHPLLGWTCVILLTWNLFLHNIFQFAIAVMGIEGVELPGKMGTDKLISLLIFTYYLMMQRSIDKLRGKVR